MSKLAPLVFSLFLFLYCAECKPKSPDFVRASGVVAGQRYEGEVDSPIARYFVEEYLQGRKSDALLHERMDRLTEKFAGRLPSSEELREISREFSIDFATLFFADRVFSEDANQQVRRIYEEELAKAGAKAEGPHPLRTIFVPGWLYVSHPENGGDLARQRVTLKSEGVETLLLEIDETGTVEENAAAVAAAVRQAQKDVVLVSASKAGTEVALALGSLLRPEETKPVKAWLNVGGILKGSPLADGVMDSLIKRWGVRTFFWWKNWKWKSLVSMETKRRTEALQNIRIPENVLVLNLLGCPLQKTLSEMGRDGYETMKELGPNDGLLLLGDAILPGTLTIAEVGMDHYFLTPDIDRITKALYWTMMRKLAGE
ncbi:MAG: hypothetical protein AB1405_13820 [Bdellovibrionota bacterium]